MFLYRSINILIFVEEVELLLWKRERKTLAIVHERRKQEMYVNCTDSFDRNEKFSIHLFGFNGKSPAEISTSVKTKIIQLYSAKSLFRNVSRCSSWRKAKKETT